MDWCVEEFENANHNPVAAIDGDTSEKIHYKEVTAGDTFAFSALGSKDPDGDDISFNCWYYPEAGNYHGNVMISQPSNGKFVVEVPKDASGSEIHVILEIKDDHKIASLYDYRRIVLTVQ